MSTGRMATDRPERYIKQLASHWREKADVHVDVDGSTTFTMAGGQTARLRPVEGAVLIETDAREFGDVVARHLVRFGERDDLSVTWE